MSKTRTTPWVLSAGKTYVSLGCIDFAQLLFGKFEVDFGQKIHFHGVDQSLISILRCKILQKMLMKNARQGYHSDRFSSIIFASKHRFLAVHPKTPPHLDR